MSIPLSVLEQLITELPELRPQMYFKVSLTALCHAMEDLVLAGTDAPLVIATFQKERFYRQEANRYQRIASITEQVYVLASPETNFSNKSGDLETIAFEPDDILAQEWNLIIIGPTFATCLVCIERFSNKSEPDQFSMDQARRFEGIWTSDRRVCLSAARLMLERILIKRPELKAKVREAEKIYGIKPRGKRVSKKAHEQQLNLLPEQNQFQDPFAQRLVTYLQAGQHKLIKAYRSMAIQEHKERLINIITNAMRQSLDPQEMIAITVQELGEALSACRCIIYQCKLSDSVAKISHEYLRPGVKSLLGQDWLLTDNLLFQEAVTTQQCVYWQNDNFEGMGRAGISLKSLPFSQLANTPSFNTFMKKWKISASLVVPVSYQGKLLGMVELHDCSNSPNSWSVDQLDLVQAIATQLGANLIQAQTYAHLEELNQQLEALERTRSNLIAITGHELRTPLSTIQICLESLSQDPDMPAKLRQVMLETALADAERMRKLVQDFLTLSHLESGRGEWTVESLPLKECVDLALSSLKSHYSLSELPKIDTDISEELPLVIADGEKLVEVLSKLLDNACKFTPAQGTVSIEAEILHNHKMLEVIITDTGRGIEPNRLEVVFDRFYQEEGALRRTVGGTGLGLAICRQIVQRLGGNIWAESEGKNKGAKFHFTIPIVETEVKPKRKTKSRINK